MAGETDLKTLLSSMTTTLAEGIFVFATLHDKFLPESIKPKMMFQETEGTTYILRKEEAETYGIPFEFPSRMISLEVHSSLDAVGFMAIIATKLAKENMGVNPVAGFYHDHIFVPDGREKDALRVLAQIAADAGQS